jgi:RNA polymerase sigma-70 factor (ECF subfamily)
VEQFTWDWPVLRRQVMSEARRWTADEHAAEDVVQRALTRAWRHRDRCADQGAPLAWVMAITRNEARRWHGRPASREIPDDVGSSANGDRAGGSLEERTITRLDVRDAVRRLSDDDRRLLALRYAEDLTQAEIARRLSWPEGTVKVRLHRLRRRLATELDPDW